MLILPIHFVLLILSEKPTLNLLVFYSCNINWILFDSNILRGLVAYSSQSLGCLPAFVCGLRCSCFQFSVLWLSVCFVCFHACVLCTAFPMSVDCAFVIVPSVFSNVYSYVQWWIDTCLPCNNQSMSSLINLFINNCCKLVVLHVTGACCIQIHQTLINIPSVAWFAYLCRPSRPVDVYLCRPSRPVDVYLCRPSRSTLLSRVIRPTCNSY
jgi:hypothetical protein